MNDAFEDWFSEWCSTKASELVGPNSFEYEGLCESIYEDDKEREIAMKVWSRDQMIEDKELAVKLVEGIMQLRILNDEVGDYEIRRAIDERLTEAYLLARDGHLRNMNGGGEE